MSSSPLAARAHQRATAAAVAGVTPGQIGMRAFVGRVTTTTAVSTT